MSQVEQLITDNLDVWASAIKKRGSQGRGSSKKIELYGIKKLRELILDLAVRGLLVPQDPNDEPASALLEKVADKKAELATSGEIKKQKKLMTVGVDDELFKLPVGWSWSRIGEFSLIGPRNNLDDNLEVSFVPMPLVSTSYKGDHGQEIRLWSELKKGYTHFSDGDIGLAKITPCFENSKASIFSNLKNGFGAGTTELHIARPFLEGINPLFILLYLKSPMFLEVGKTKMTGSAGQKRVPKSFFEGNPFPLPPEAEQPRIVAKVDELMALCDQLEQQTEDSLSAHQTLVETLLNALLDVAQSRDDSSSKESSFDQAWQRIAEHFDVLFTTEHSIDQLKQTILQLAVMGKLVPQDPNDEPASVLLEKIAAEKERLVKEGKIKKQKPLPEIGKDEKPFELPVGWEWSNLLDLITVMDAGWSPACPPEPSPSEDVWGVLKTTAVQTMEYRQQENKVLAESKEPRPQYEVKVGDILITRAGPKNRVGGVMLGSEY
jgi:type I restriction enzyme S subunit